jgi:hypothetical protein
VKPFKDLMNGAIIELFCHGTSYALWRARRQDGKIIARGPGWHAQMRNFRVAPALRPA